MDIKEQGKTKLQRVRRNISKSIVLGVSLFLIIKYYPAITNEFKYFLIYKGQSNSIISIRGSDEDSNQNENVIYPVDKKFSLIIPKLGINSKIIADVDPFNEREYLSALKDGIAHSKTSTYPSAIGNVFLFSHSSSDFEVAKIYNSVFYLLYKLKADDRFYIVYNSEIYEYKVYEIKYIKPEDTSSLESASQKRIATLMTCWPPGTDLQRLIVIGELNQIHN